MTRRGSDPAWANAEGFLQIHFALLDAVGGSYPAAALWDRIHYRSREDGWWTASREQMCAELRLSEHVLRRAITELRDAGLVESQRVSAFDPTLRYRITWGSSADLHDVTEDSTITVTEDSSVTSLEKEVSPPLPPSGGSEGALFDVAAPPQRQDPLERFDEWWAAYPRKVGKDAARKAWAARVRAGVDPGVLVSAVQRQAAGLREDHERGLRELGRSVCPHPSTWLSRGSWEDEPDAVVVPITERQAVASYGSYDPAAAAAFRSHPGRELYG